MLRTRKRSDGVQGEGRRSIARGLLPRKASAPSFVRPLHHRSRGGFVNPWPSAGRATSRFASSASRTFLRRSLPRKSNDASDEVVAALSLLAGRPDFDAAAAALQRNPRACAAIWLGHCTWVLRLRKLVIITDPVWATKLAAGQIRALSPVCQPEDIPTVDVCLLSSAHPDHYDRTAITKLCDRVREWLVPLGIAQLLRDCGVSSERITELDWWSETRIGNTRIICTPAQHRQAPNAPRALWCSWLVLAHGHSLFYCGATGYRAVSRGADAALDIGPGAFHARKHAGPVCPAFKEIVLRYGRVDTAILPLGHYKPRPSAAAVQGDPIDMLHIHRDLRARKSLANRWGTYASANNEALLDPVRALENAIVDSPVAENEFVYVHHGRMVVT